MKTLCEDKSGNKIMVSKNTLFLKLASENHNRNIGTVVPESDWFHVTRESEHLLRKANAYGFNYQIISMFRKYRNVLLTAPEGNFLIPMDEILTYGSFLWFKEQGFERQIFFTLEQINPFRIKL